MREKLLALLQLQKVDLEIAAARKAAETYPKQLGELEKELAAARSVLEAERSKLTDMDRQRSTLEQTIVEEKDKVKKWEARLTEQRSTREYSALAREIDIAKKSNLTMGEESVELAKQVAAQREVAKQKEGVFSAKATELQGKMDEIKAKLAEAEGAMSGLEGKRAEAAKTVDATLLKRYDQVRKKRMPALVSVVHPGTCQGCRMNVPPNMYNQLIASMGIGECPRCNRIIHAAEALEPKAA
ncbi:MAG: hypothetical protein K1X89_08545 [Myxococcaceae bacterium]|nr:hypothetical protein [Myxococcaceae bacterium]